MKATIKELREAALLTQEQLAEALGVSPSSIYKWEAGLVEPTLTNKRFFCEVVQVRPDQVRWRKAGVSGTRSKGV